MRSLIITATLILIMILLTSCEKSSTSSINSLNPLSDASETIILASSEESGGITDQLGDLAELTADGVFQDDKSVKPYKSKSWDEEYQLWIVEMERERGDLDGERYGYFYRKYSLQFLDGEDQPLKYRVTEEDTAKTAIFNSLDATGIHWNRRAYHQLNDLNISWVATDIDSDILTVNGSFERAAYDSLTRKNFTRTLDHNISLDIQDLKGPRGSRRDLSEKISGDIYGSYECTY